MCLHLCHPAFLFLLVICVVDVDIQLLERRARLTKWIQQCSTQSVRDDFELLTGGTQLSQLTELKSEAQYLGAICLLMSIRAREPAANLANARGDHKLAMLLSTAGRCLLHHTV